MNGSYAQARESTIKSIQEAVASLFGLSVEELRQGGRQQVVAVPRHIAMYLAKEMTDASLSEIGEHFGGRHHTTVMQSIAKIHAMRQTDTGLDRVVSRLLTSLNAKR
jgi:chromosomal replication initiator protein